jgi:hypothetical protein
MMKISRRIATIDAFYKLLINNNLNLVARTSTAAAAAPLSVTSI